MMVKSKVKYIQSLSQKKQRDDDGLFVAEGPKIINELLGSNLVQLQELFALKEWIESSNHNPGFDPSNAEEIDESVLSRISFLSTPNQVLGIFKKPSAQTLSLKGKIIVLTDNIQDPGNMGSIIRCADWFGIEQVICSPDCADAFGPKTVQSSMGSIGRVKVFYRNLISVINENPQISVYAATLDGTPLSKVSPPKEAMIIIGNESKGISEQILNLPIQKITIERKGRAESLNAAVAAGIILAQLTR
jgi:TrmH family RNA methyltransferase